MDFFFNSLRKLLTLSLFVAFAVVFTYIPQQYGDYKTVPEAEAQWAVIDNANLAVNTAILGNTTLISTKELTLDNIGWVLGKAVVANMVASTVDWINSGFRGSPAFVQDLDRFLLNVADQVAGAYLQELGGPLSYLCSPFRLDIQIALALEYQQARERLPYQGCELSEAFENFEDFVQGDFLQGGWQDWIQITAQPEKYTSYGARLAAGRAFDEEITARQAAERETLSYGDGFLSFKTCADVEGPGGTVYQDCQVVTPGKTIATRLSDSLGLSEQSLITADEINEIIGALISQVAVKALTGTAGLLGLSANTGYSYSGYDGGFTGSIRDEAAQAEQSSIANAAGDMGEILATQREYRTVASSYNRQALAIMGSNPSVEQRNAASEVAIDTNQVMNATARNISEIETQISAYDALTTEYNNTNTSRERRDQITAEQREIVVTVLRAGYYTESDIRSSELIWDTTLNPPDND